MHTSTVNEPAARAGRREWLGLVVLVLPALLLSVDLSVLFLALPHLAEDLQPSSSQQLWIMDIYGFLVAGLLVTMGTLGDRIGRRKLLLIGGAFFGIASVIAAYSTSAGMLISARALLGIAGATLAPSTLALIINMFKDDKQRGVAIAIWSSCFVGGGVIGPTLGGLMLSWFWWGSVFLLAVPVMVLLLIAGPVLLPEFRNPAHGRLDLTSVALSLLTIIPVIYGLKELARTGWEPVNIAAILVGVAFGAIFVRRQRRLADPMLDVSLFKIKVYRSAMMLGLLIGIIQGGVLMLVNIQLQVVEGLSPLGAGLWLVPGAVATVVAIMLSPKLATRFRPAYLIAAGLLASVIGYIVFALVPDTGGLPWLVTGTILTAVGLGPAVALGYGLVLGSVPPEKAGAASGLAESSGEFGLASGIAILGTIGSFVYRNELSIPAGVPADAANSVTETIANVFVAASQLSASTAAQLIDSARDAFTSGLNVVGVVAAVLFVGLAVLSVAWLRQVPITPSAPPAPEEAAAAEETQQVEELAEPQPAQ